MPHYRWHVLGAVGMFFLVMLLLRYAQVELDFVMLAFSFLLCVFAAMIPDIDSKSSKVFRIFTDLIVVFVAGMIVYYTFSEWFTMLWLLLFWFLLSGPVLLVMPVKHRGFVHTIWIAAIFGAVTAFIGIAMLQSLLPGLFAFAGYFSHLLMDRKMF
ncbi:MAG: metal-dependent hydrolase [Candidatus Aenigmatarchaeota archaeon]